MQDFLSGQEKIRNYVLAMPDNQPRAYEVRASSAGDCPRLMYYLRRDGSHAPEYKQAIRMLTGKYLHNMWRDIMVGAFGDDFVGAEEEMTFEMDGVKVSGHPDGALKSLGCVYEFKSVSEATFKMVALQGHPLPAHVEQGNIYAMGLGMPFILFHYFNKNSGEDCFFIAERSESLAKSSIAKFKLSETTLVDRPYHDPTDSPCWFCPKKEECYAGYRESVAEMGKAKLAPEDNPELHKVASHWWSMRELRLDTEKKEASAKMEAAKQMLLSKLNNCFIGEFVIDIKLGKGDNPIPSIKRSGNEQSS